MFVIEKGVPTIEGSKYLSYPFEEMDVGDSFVFSIEHYKKISSAKTQVKKRTGKVFSLRKQENGSFRCWRTK